MKKKWLILSFVSFLIAPSHSTLAADDATLPFHIHNTKWDRKVQLSGQINYSDRKVFPILHVLEEITQPQNQSTLETSIPTGTITKIELFLNSYSESADDKWSDTLLGEYKRDFSSPILGHALDNIVITICQKQPKQTDKTSLVLHDGITLDFKYKAN